MIVLGDPVILWGDLVPATLVEAFAVSASIFSLLVGTIVFVNSVETLGQRLGLTRHATGALLAAALTALPEIFIAIVASFSDDGAKASIGVASVLSAPSITLLLGFPVLAALGRVRRVGRQVAILYVAFAASTSLLPLTALVGEGAPVRTIGAAFVAAYVLIARRIATEEGELMEGRPLSYIERLLGRVYTPFTTIQVLAGLALMIFGADNFIEAVSVMAHPFFAAMLLSPLATCLEEVLVAFYWAAKGKGDIATSLLAGENAIQATFVYGAGLLLTGLTPPPQGLTIIPIYVAGALTHALFIFTSRPRASSLALLYYAAYIGLFVRPLL